MCGSLIFNNLNTMSTTTTLRMATSTMIIHPYLSFLDIGTKGYHPHELLVIFYSSRRIYTTMVLRQRGCQSIGSSSV